MKYTRFIILISILCSSILSYSQCAFYNLGKSYAEEGNFDEAIRLTRQCLELDSNNPDKYNLLLDYNALCEYFSYTMQPDSCYSYAQKIISLWQNVEGVEYSDILRNISHHLHRGGFSQQAIDYRKELVKILEEKYGADSPRLINEYRILSSFSKESGNNTMAVEYAKIEENLAYKTISIEDNFERVPFKDSFSWLRYIIEDCEEPIAGIHYLLNILNDHRDAIDSESRMHTLNSIWAISRDNDFLDGCIAVYKEQALYGTLKERLTNLINIYAEDKNLKNDVNAAKYAQTFYDLAMQNALSTFFKSEDIEHLLSFLPDYYSTIGLTRYSFEMARKNYEYRVANNLELFFDDVKVLIAASSLKDEAEYAIEFGKNLLYSHRYEDDAEVLRIIYENLAGVYQSIGDTDNAEKYLALIGETNDFQTLYSKAGIYLFNGDMKSLLPVALQLNSNKGVPDENRELVLWMLMCSARDARDKDILLNNANEYVRTYREHLLKELPLMSEEEQASFIRSSIFSNPISFDFFIGLHETNVSWSAAKEAYDYALLSKGIILTSQNEFRDVIKNSPDSLIRSKWTIFQQNKGDFSLQNEIIKRELIKYASQTSSYLKKLSYTWLNVRDALKPDEVAIELVKCYNFDNFTDKQSDAKYVALIVKHGYDEPFTVALSSTNFLDKMGNEELLSIDDLDIYENLWKPLEPYFDGVRTIFFSPVEELNYIAMEYASMGTERVCDKWNLIRVSSTREVIEYADHPHKDKAVLYGGLKYNVGKDDLIAESRSGYYHPISSNRAITTDNLRYGVDDLPGTLSEVQEIYKLFSTKPSLITDISGTEESFKALAGSSVDIIHLATHGFFWDEGDIEKRSYVNFLRNVQSQPKSFEDYAMLRSGLIFSGANIGLMGEELPADVEDGVLTAQEISSMNLGNVDMVVMSACESGLGETSGEGVFGLQRGFKLAGANTLLMSLWKVDDAVTPLLMTDFYRNYLSGKSKQESLRLAQQSLRNNPDYSDPKYWAAFILLDGLN